ncbi:TetR/AcrR family transcriptional regulator [Streptomyces sp. NBC_01716]|uniref:TetR/AcrR family transcriptional regulator n=1 Tax=Streptomyces sp. NBC_01716 TaxID=2975917 RepID=UPI002E330568|nr:helix-turn-helix domain-containing protein [Streptomyces sp. NBC_01716]
MAGRPRGVDDSVILRATADVVGRVGPAGLTLAAVAREVGLVPGTLMQRFGSKRGLLLALAERAAESARDQARTSPERLRRANGSALAALTALLVESMEPMTTPQTYANHLAFLCLDLGEPEFHAHALTVHRAERRAVEELLSAAVAAGELRAGTDVGALARSVQAMSAGAGLVWALDREGTLEQRIRQEIDAVLAHHVSSPVHRPGHSELEEA